jgi:hypothetical protein
MTVSLTARDRSARQFLDDFAVCWRGSKPKKQSVCILAAVFQLMPVDAGRK